MPYSWNKKGNQAKPPGGRRGGKMGKPPASGRSGGKMGKPPRPSAYDMENTLRQSVTDQIEELRSIAAGLASAMQGSSQTDADMAQRQALAAEMAARKCGARPSDRDVRQGFMPPEPPPLPQGPAINPGEIPPPMPTPESARAERMRRITAMARKRIGMK